MGNTASIFAFRPVGAVMKCRFNNGRAKSIRLHPIGLWGLNVARSLFCAIRSGRQVALTRTSRFWSSPEHSGRLTIPARWAQVDWMRRSPTILNTYSPYQAVTTPTIQCGGGRKQVMSLNAIEPNGHIYTRSRGTEHPSQIMSVKALVWYGRRGVGQVAAPPT